MAGSVNDASRRLTVGEEIANAVSHGMGLLAAVAVAPLLISHAVRRGGPGEIVGASVFSATVILLYAASTLYHALPWGRGKRVFRIIDHGAIYLLIAGTYTPFCLGVLRGPMGWTLFGAVWALAATGVTMKALTHVPRPVLSTVFYVAMGWVGLVVARPLAAVVPGVTLRWIIAGGIAYTGGLVFYAMPRVRYAHFVWHLFVVVGTVCHVAAVFTATR